MIEIIDLVGIEFRVYLPILEDDEFSMYEDARFM